MGLTRLAVNKPWPFPLAGEGMQALMDPTEEGLSLTLVCTVDRPTSAEIHGMDRVRIALYPSPPLVWVILAAAGGGLSLDAPYAVGLTGPDRAEAVKNSSKLARNWPEATRAIVTVALVDLSSTVIRRLKAVSLTRDWWMAMAKALEACPDQLSQEQYRAAMQRDTALSTNTMMVRATAVEMGGI